MHTLSISLYEYIYIYTCTYIYTYIHISIEREREIHIYKCVPYFFGKTHMSITDSGVNGRVSVVIFRVDIDAGIQQLGHTYDIIYRQEDLVSAEQ
jgi:hypothetical protein